LDAQHHLVKEDTHRRLLLVLRDGDNIDEIARRDGQLVLHPELTTEEVLSCQKRVSTVGFPGARALTSAAASAILPAMSLLSHSPLTSFPTSQASIWGNAAMKSVKRCLYCARV
jgi:hypothetical protein